MVSRPIHRRFVILLILLPVVAVYWQVGGHSFVNWDDNLYVYENPQVRRGLTFQGVAWAFTTSHASLKQPLTWLSHMADISLFGLDPGWHHRVNVLFHAVNAALLFLVLHSMTGAVWRSAFVSALFAVHPLHVESVAWVAERKDVLSTMFWLLTTAAYVRYARLPGVLRGAFVVLPFALGLLCKPMLVTLPFTLLLLDYWPLGRWRPGGGPAAAAGTHPGSTVSRLIVEKIPLMLLSAASAVVTYAVAGDLIASWGQVPFGLRISNAIVSYAAYLGKAVWPSSLAVIYPFPPAVPGIPAWRVAGALLLLGGLSFAALRSLNARPWLAVGWSWYLGTLLPVIGVVQAGPQAMADRFAYVPLTGIAIAVAWDAMDRSVRMRIPRAAPAIAGFAVVAALTAAAWVQAGYWKDGVTLFGRAVAVTRDNHMAHNSLGTNLAARGRTDEAIAHYRAAIRIWPRYAVAYNNMGIALVARGDVDGAIANYREAIRIRPDYAEAHANLGLAFMIRGMDDDAAASFRESLRLDPGQPDACNNLGNVLAARGDLDGAVANYREAIRMDPEFAIAHNNLGVALARLGKRGDAVVHFREAVRIDPSFSDAVRNLRDALAAGRP